MSCNGCRVLRRGCSDQCVLRQCLDWIETPQAQANATLFVSKFFGRSDLMSFISAVPPHRRPALFQSLLFEACSRSVNPVNGAVGLLSTGNWHICEAAVETVLSGGSLRPFPAGILPSKPDEELGSKFLVHGNNGIYYTDYPPGGGSGENSTSFGSGLSEISPEIGRAKKVKKNVGNKEPKLLNLFE
ncbi:LOB domain-containing protein 38-like [Dorcoceras hygrometricum]|uniref:LOB domain-containing protein 38-like n=1 Tax=Dorcoceras hygrometricum TaxID=472368 RepID=A0A2Z7D4K3_9LAMI|nr:LOB domain-containing protein 38-like [Dorcoceras hygrometricum]